MNILKTIKIIHFKQANCIVCTLYLNKTLFKKTMGVGVGERYSITNPLASKENNGIWKTQNSMTPSQKGNEKRQAEAGYEEVL